MGLRSPSACRSGFLANHLTIAKTIQTDCFQKNAPKASSVTSSRISVITPSRGLRACSRVDCESSGGGRTSGARPHLLITFSTAQEVDRGSDRAVTNGSMADPLSRRLLMNYSHNLFWRSGRNCGSSHSGERSFRAMLFLSERRRSILSSEACRRLFLHLRHNPSSVSSCLDVRRMVSVGECGA